MSLINEALKQTRGQTAQASHDGPMGMPVTHPRERERRTIRTDVLIVGAVLLLPLLVLGGAAGLYLLKGRGTAPPPVAAPVVAAVPPAVPVVAVAPVVTPAAVPAPAPVPVAAPAATVPVVPLASAPPIPDAGTLPVPAPKVAVARIAALPPRELPQPAVAIQKAPVAEAPAAKPQAAPQVSSTKPAARTTTPAARAALDKLRASVALTAIVGSGPAAKALVNGRIVKVGDSVEGAVIAAIGADAVTVELDGEKTDLVLK